MDVKSISFACPRRSPSLFRWKLFLLYVILLLEAVAGVTLLPAPHSLRLLVGNIYWNGVFIQRWPSLMSGTMRCGAAKPELQHCRLYSAVCRPPGHCRPTLSMLVYFVEKYSDMRDHAVVDGRRETSAGEIIDKMRKCSKFF